MAIEKIGDIQTFNYNGAIQTFIVPFTGIYELHLIGASGGYHNSVGCLTGLGGVTKQYVELKKGTVLYIVVGGKGLQANAKTISGGYNGGGGGDYSHINDNVYIGGGGGATHIATSNGILSTLSDVRNTILAVAGGGGGFVCYYNEGIHSRGGSGGGLTSAGTTPATQTTGYAFGQGGALSGGGWYGGITSNKLGTPANYGTNSGGSGYLSNTDTYTINGIPYTSSTATRGQTTTPENGSAKITFLAETSSITAYLGDASVNTIFAGNVEVSAIL